MREIDIEENVATNPLPMARAYMGDSAFSVRILGRQVPCRYGIIDMMLAVGQNLWLIEFKSSRAGQAVLGQLARYRKALGEINCYKVVPPCPDMDILYRALDWHVVNPMLVVVAPSFSNEVLMGANICIQVDSNFCYQWIEEPDASFDNSFLETSMIPFMVSTVEHQREMMRMIE